MKIKGLFFITTPFVILFLLLPMLFGIMVPKMSIAYPEPASYERRVTASGKLASASQTVVEASLPLVAKEVFVEEGDTVYAGQTIATIDTDASMQALISLLAAASSLGSDVLAAYGFSDLSLDSLDLPESITATANGVLNEVNLQAGTLYYPTESVAVIAKPNNLSITLQVAESDIEEVAVGQTVRYTASATGNKVYLGTVTKIHSTAYEVLSGTTKATVVSVEVAPKGSNSLRAGYTVNGQIVVDSIENTLTLPYTAVGQDESGEYVYLYQNGAAIRQAITTGQEFSGYTEVLSGVSFDSPVLLDASAVEQDGMRIRANVEEAAWIS